MKPVRNSSFELLRIILIMMIMIGHGNLWFIGSRYATESEHLIKCLIQSICIGAVDGFVLISGWFGIRSRLSKIGDLMFMILFCTVPVLVAAIIFHNIPFSTITSITGLYQYVMGGENYWFVVDYIGLLIAAPLLNTGFERLSRETVKRLLLAGYALIAFYDFVLRTDVLGSGGGYSILWFSYLYLLARYMRTYGLKLIQRYRCLLLVSSIILQTLFYYKEYIGLRYTNPLILLEAVSLIYIFAQWKFQNKTINYVAGASLMAYLIHMQPVFVPYISHYLYCEYQSLGYGLYIAEITGLCLMAFLLAIPINLLQIQIYRLFKNCLNRCHPRP